MHLRKTTQKPERGAQTLFDIIKHPPLIASFKHYWGS